MTAAGVVTGTAPAVGNYTVTVTVSDGQGASAVQIYPLSVASAVNYPPAIISQPPTSASTAQTYSYQVVVADADHDQQYYSMSTLPVVSGPSISTSGLVTWSNPTVGTYTFIINDMDQGGVTCQQIYTLKVTQDTAPTITGTPLGTVTAGLPYRYDVQASDADGDALTYALSGAPTWLSIDQNGRITGAPGIAQIGTYNSITIQVTDQVGSQATKTFNLTVQADTTPPTIELQISPTSSATAALPVGTLVTFLVFASDNVGVTSLKLTVGTTNVPLDAKGQGQMTMTAVGNFTATAVAGDAAGYTTTAPLQTVYVNNPSGTPPTTPPTTRSLRRPPPHSAPR
jgi:hypothetical protein